MVDIPHLDEEALAELRDVMEDEFSLLIETYLTDSKERIERLKEAMMKGDSDAFTKAAHSFKGSCINIGATRLGELCQKAETAGRNGDLNQGSPVVDEISTEFQRVIEAFDTLMVRDVG
ncbi:Hpt domain-containing protein [Marinobacter sp. F3R11]|uniref:Hpt domain-containing protein n=1 Tax=Marinobacter sp. F3R11 TaxID=2267231 RepID=UPI000DE8B62F|nr:Hpt domain-containing protein [Marinobacter sp. F3R11]RBW50044.1 Hpt domain-containing protein [Marinobacter sp. F3R11]